MSIQYKPDYEGVKRITGGSKETTTIWGTWECLFFGPIISADDFEFTFMIHKLSCLAIGLMRPDHPKDHCFCYGGGIGWGWHTYDSDDGDTISRIHSPGRHEDFDPEYGPFLTGDTVRFVVNKTEKTIHVQKNDNPLHCLFQDVEFPEKLHIAMARYTDFCDVELVSLYIGCSVDVLKRIESIADSFGDITIPLKNKELSLSKSLLINSRINSLSQIDEYRGLVDLEINVEEITILLLLLQKKVVDIQSDNFLDYFLFFRYLGLKREMKHILDLISQIKTFEELYRIFKRICKSQHENEILKSWFSENQKNIDEFTADIFDTSFALTVFNELKKREDELVSNRSLFLLDSFVGFVFAHLERYEKVINPLDHSDFQDVNFDELTVKNIFQRLQRGELSNINLVSTEGKIFPTHIELLVYRFSYFQRMFEFDGVEKEAFKNGENIQMDDMDDSFLTELMNYIYTGKIETEDVELLIKLIVKADMFISRRLSEYCFKKFESIYSKINDDSIDEILDRVGYLLHNNDAVNKRLIPILVICSRRKKEYIKKKIRKSSDRYLIRTKVSRIDVLEKQIKGLKSENIEMKKQISENKSENEDFKSENEDMKKQIEELFAIVRPVGGRKRKREDEDEDEEEEEEEEEDNPKKKRKKD